MKINKDLTYNKNYKNYKNYRKDIKKSPDEFLTN